MQLIRTLQAALAALGIMSTTGSATGTEAVHLEGRMNCEVMSNTVMEVEDGKPTTYSGYKDRFEVGDTLALHYSLHVAEYSTFSMIWIDEQRDILVMTFVANNDEVRAGAKVYGGSWNLVFRV